MVEIPLPFILYPLPFNFHPLTFLRFCWNAEYTVCVAQVLLSGKDWQARALLRAQLIEEGVSVEAYETVDEALAHLEWCFPLPALLIADISTSDGPTTDVEHLT